MQCRNDLDGLLVDASWVRALARNLVSDESQAEDVAQDAWVSALEQQPDARRPIRAWVATVLRRRAGKLEQRDTNRRDRERNVSRAEAIGSTLDVVERTSTHRDIVEAVLALDEPYRSTVLMRFFDDLSYAEIARRTGTTRATVNSRLTRGLARLRDRLDGRYGQRNAWLLLLQPIAQTSKGVAATVSGISTMTTPTQVALIALASTAAVVGDYLPESIDVPPRLEVATVGSTVAQEPDDNTWEVTLEGNVRVGAAVDALVLRTGAGSIEVVAGEGEALQIEARVRADTEVVDEADRTEELQDHVKFSTKDGALVIEDAHSIEGAESTGWQVSLLVRTPRNFDITAHADAGSVSIAAAKSTVNASADAGSVHLSVPDSSLRSATLHADAGSVFAELGGVEEALTIQTGAGSVKASLGGGGSSRHVSIQSGAGSIALTLPAGVSGAFDLGTGVGSITLPDELDLEATRDIVGATATGRVGDAAAKYELRCGTGSITIATE